MTHRLCARFGDRTYSVHYGTDSRLQLGELLQRNGLENRALIISHPELRTRFGGDIENSVGADIAWATFPSGERNKDTETVRQLYEICAKQRIGKNDPIIALGGGVVQDVANYVAATYQRGVPFIQVPTTLLSQADIGFGGCAIDHDAAKSLIGQFYQPRLVVMDPIYVCSLPRQEIANGLAEIINKTVCLGGREPERLRKDLRMLWERDPDMVLRNVRRSNCVKLRIIEEDETGRKGTRQLLDWGHTITYALERASGYAIPHGEALGIGMCGAAVLSHRLGYLREDRMKQLTSLIKAAGLPTQLTNIDHEELLEYMQLDQKAVDGHNRFVLLRDLGDAFISEPIVRKDIRDVLEELSG